MNTIEHIRRLLKDNFLTDAHVEGFWRRPSAAPGDKARFYARVHLPSGHLISCSEGRISDEVSVEALVWDKLYRHLHDYLNEPWTV